MFIGSVIGSISVITLLQRTLLIHELSLHYVTVGVWCAISATRISGPFFFVRLYIYSNRYGSRTLTLFIITYLITKGPVPFYQQASATIHTTTNNSGMSCLRNIFAGKKSRGLWLARLSDTKPCRSLLAGNFEEGNVP